MNLWLGVGALISVALVFLLVPLWRTRLAPRLAVSIVAGEEEAGSMSDPGSARAGRRWMTLALLGVMPALTAGLYLYLGAPTILQEQALTQAHAAYDTDAMVKALELAGLAADQQKKWAESLHFWRRLMKKLPKNSEFYEEIARAVKIAEGKAMEASGLGERARLAPPEKAQTPHSPAAPGRLWLAAADAKARDVVRNGRGVLVGIFSDGQHHVRVGVVPFAVSDQAAFAQQVGVVLAGNPGEELVHLALTLLPVADLAITFVELTATCEIGARPLSLGGRNGQ